MKSYEAMLAEDFTHSPSSMISDFFAASKPWSFKSSPMASLDASSGCAMQLPTFFSDFLMISQHMVLVLAMTEAMGTISAETENVPLRTPPVSRQP